MFCIPNTYQVLVGDEKQALSSIEVQTLVSQFGLRSKFGLEFGLRPRFYIAFYFALIT